jgi:hypothetical protein
MPRTLRRETPSDAVRLLQKLLYSNGYLQSRPPADGLFDLVTHDETVLFQLQHIDRDGLQLKPDGVVGPVTWWALQHPSGESQRNHLQGEIPENLTSSRSALLELLLTEHAKPVNEIPDGSNRSPDIDTYWGETGVNGLPWCCAFVSWTLFEVLGEYPIDGKHHLGVQRMWRTANRLGMGTEQPKPGDIFVQIKSGGNGHTGFVIGISHDGEQIYTCEGNAGNRLKLGRRSPNSINHYIDCLNDGQGQDFPRGELQVGILDGQPDR